MERYKRLEKSKATITKTVIAFDEYALVVAKLGGLSGQSPDSVLEEWADTNQRVSNMVSQILFEEAGKFEPREMERFLNIGTNLSRRAKELVVEAYLAANPDLDVERVPVFQEVE